MKLVCEKVAHRFPKKTIAKPLILATLNTVLLTLCVDNNGVKWSTYIGRMRHDALVGVLLGLIKDLHPFPATMCFGDFLTLSSFFEYTRLWVW